MNDYVFILLSDVEYQINCLLIGWCFWRFAQGIKRAGAWSLSYKHCGIRTTQGQSQRKIRFPVFSICLKLGLND